MAFWQQLSELILDIAPWLVLGLIAAGLVKAWIPESTVTRWLGGTGQAGIWRAALVGTPLPLCSCSVIPMAMGLHRNGASKPATVAFLVSTPETGIDSIALSWVLLGPFLTVQRIVSAITGAVASGLMVRAMDRETPPPAPISQCTSSCCGKKNIPQGPMARTLAGLRYAFTDMWDDLAVWLLGGILLTAVVMTWMPPGELSRYAQGSWFDMIIMVVVAVPVYVCATASTPLAAAMIHAGLTPGMALAFMIAGPATNLTTMAIIRKQLGGRTLIAYLLAIVGSAVIMGLVTDLLAPLWPIQAGHASAEQALPLWLSLGLSSLLGLMTLNTLRRKLPRPAF
ncbi:MAG: SO_0444 family Cu/Zn efflux transporter [Magnetococcales bacterium]|nr:SO_0444 family Cu/Zn efflux transporter [Magnetococcales bacterium]